MSTQIEQSKKVTAQVLALLMKNDNDPAVNLAAITIASCVLAHSMDTPKNKLMDAMNTAWEFVQITSTKGKSIQ